MSTDGETDGPLLAIEDLKVHFPIRGGLLGTPKGWVRAVDGVSLTVRAGETVALVGESGCGKTTTGFAVLGLHRPTAGRVLFDGGDVAEADPALRHRLRRDIQIVFQDPFSSLDPRMTVGDSIGEPLVVHDGLRGAALRDRVGELLEMVGLQARHRERYPNEFSGGQRQRIVIARALALQPRLIVCDEPVSALDVSIRSQILNLLARLQDAFGLAYLFISHDLSVVRHVSDRVAVMYLGHIVEEGDAATVFEAPRHPYTEALLSAIPVPDPKRQRARRRQVLQGDLPNPADPPAGCPFVTRCPIREPRCARDRPRLEIKESGQRAACHFR